MTLEELSTKYGIAESSIQKRFSYVQDKILTKYGVKIVKEGRGKNAQYYETNVSHAMTLYEEDKNRKLYLDSDSLLLDNGDLLVLLGIIGTPLLVFRGTYENFLQYIQVKNTKNNIEALKKSLLELQQIGYIKIMYDKDIFIASLDRETEITYQSDIDRIRLCRAIAIEEESKNWTSLFKVWTAIIRASEDQPFTNGMIAAYTGMSDKTVRKYRNILERANVFNIDKIYKIKGNDIRCLGQEVELNGFYNKEEKIIEVKSEEIDNREIEE